MKCFYLSVFMILMVTDSLYANDAQSNTNAESGTEKVNSYTISPDAKLVQYDRMLFGQFSEYFHRQVNSGIFDPGSQLSDPNGFRMDVTEAIRELKVPTVRWPGGCFVSTYH